MAIGHCSQPSTGVELWITFLQGSLGSCLLEEKSLVKGHRLLEQKFI